MTAEIEEVVLDADLVDFEQFLPDFGDHALHLAAGSDVGGLSATGGRRRSERPPCPWSTPAAATGSRQSDASGRSARLVRAIARPSSIIVERLRSEPVCLARSA